MCRDKHSDRDLGPAANHAASKLSGQKLTAELPGFRFYSAASPSIFSPIETTPLTLLAIDLSLASQACLLTHQKVRRQAKEADTRHLTFEFCGWLVCQYFDL